MSKTKIYYHFTCREHLPSILREQCLRTTESNVGSISSFMAPMGEHVGPEVVWLLDDPSADLHDHGLAGGIVDKGAIRFEVCVPATRWKDWAPAAQMHPAWRKGLVRGGGGSKAAAHWHVLADTISASQWIRVKDMRTGLAIDFSVTAGPGGGLAA